MECISSGNHFITESYLGVHTCWIPTAFTKQVKKPHRANTCRKSSLTPPPRINPCQPRPFVYDKNGYIEMLSCSMAINTKQIPIDCCLSPKVLSFCLYTCNRTILEYTICSKKTINVDPLWNATPDSSN